MSEPRLECNRCGCIYGGIARTGMQCLRDIKNVDGETAVCWGTIVNVAEYVGAFVRLYDPVGWLVRVFSPALDTAQLAAGVMP